MANEATCRDEDTRHSCAIYARVAVTRRGQDDPLIDAQLQQARKYAAEHGFTIYDEYVDAGASGASEDRPGFRQMMAKGLSADPPFRTILVQGFSRFFRNTALMEKTRASLRLNGVDVRSITQSFDDEIVGWESLVIRVPIWKHSENR